MTGCLVLADREPMDADDNCDELMRGLVGHWDMDGNVEALRKVGNVRFVNGRFDRGLSLEGDAYARLSKDANSAFDFDGESCLRRC